MNKFIADTMMDDSNSWDTVRIIAGPVAAAASGIILYHMLRDSSLADHLLEYAGGLGATWGAYAGSVVGHSWAKK